MNRADFTVIVSQTIRFIEYTRHLKGL